MSIKTGTVHGGRIDPLYNVLKKDNRENRIKGEYAGRGRMASGGISQTRHSKNGESAATLMKP